MQSENGAAAEHWLPLSEAAGILGVSVDTVRRRVKRGELDGEQRPTPQGFVWWVHLGGNADAANLGSMPPGQRPQVDSTPRRQDLGTLVDLIRDQQAELLRRTEAAATWQSRAEMLAHQLELARETIKALEAPRSPVASNLTAHGPEPDPEPPEPPRRPDPTPAPVPPADEDGRQPWWRRWWAWAVIAL
jgi:hypothetical protein